MRNEIAKEVDVVVCGGGPAGIVAAIAAARNGARTLLLEQHAFLGGNLAMYLPVLTFHNLRGEQIIKGIPQDIIDRLTEIGGFGGHQLCRIHSSTAIIDVEKFKFVAQEMCLEAGIELLFHTFVTDVEVETGELRKVVAENKSGRLAVRAKVFIDATGDGDVAARAGARYVMGRPEDGKMQPPTLMFRLGNVDMKTFMTDIVRRGGRESGHVKADHQAYEKGYHFVFFGYHDAVELARSKGEFNVPWNQVLFITTPIRGELAINMVKVPGTDSTDAVSLTRAEIEGRRQMFTIAAFLKKYIPGFENSHLLNSAHQIGIRESRRVKGEYILTGDDLAHVRQFPDAIARGGYMVDLHSPDGVGGVQAMLFKYGYSIPYRCLVPLGVENLLVAGRCVSADWVAFGSIRVTAICMAMGQAAGTAAAICVKTGKAPRAVDVSKVQETLLKDKAVLAQSSMFDEMLGGFFRLRCSVNQLLPNGTFTLACDFDNFTNLPESAQVELKPISNVIFDQTAFATGQIDPFHQHDISVAGRQQDVSKDIEYTVRLRYENGAKIEKVQRHLLLKKGLTPDWGTGDWISLDVCPEQFSASRETAPLHGARFNVSYDDKGMQFLIEVRDDFLRPSDIAQHKGHFTVDCVELFLDGRRAADVGKKLHENGVYQLIVYPGNPGKTPAFYQLTNFHGTPERAISLDVSSEPTEEGYRLRVSVPFDQLCVEPGVPDKVGFDLAVNTMNAEGVRIAQYIYAGAPDNWENAAGWRELLLR